MEVPRPSGSKLASNQLKTEPQVGVLSKYTQIMLPLLAVAFQDLDELHKEIELSMSCFAAQISDYTLVIKLTKFLKRNVPLKYSPT